MTLCIGVRDKLPSIKTTWYVAENLTIPGKKWFFLTKKNHQNQNVKSSNIETMNQYSHQFFLYS